MTCKEGVMHGDCFVGDSNNIWYIARKYSALMKIDRKSCWLNFIMPLDKEKLYRSVVMTDDSLLLFPSKHGNIVVYSYDGKVSFREVPKSLFDRGCNWAAQYIRFGDYVFFYWSDPIINRYNFKTNEWSSFYKLRNVKTEILFGNCFPIKAFIIDEYLFFIIGTSNRVLKVDPNSLNFESCEIELPTCSKYLIRAMYEDGKLWVVYKSTNGEVYITCCEDFESFKCDRAVVLEDDKVEDSSEMFSAIVKYGTGVAVLPGMHEKAYYINDKWEVKDISNIIPVQKIDDLNDGFMPYNYYRDHKIGNKSFLLHSRTGKGLFFTDRNEDIMIEEYQIHEFSTRKVMQNEFRNNEMIVEGDFGLRDFIYSL